MCENFPPGPKNGSGTTFADFCREGPSPARSSLKGPLLEFPPLLHVLAPDMLK